MNCVSLVFKWVSVFFFVNKVLNVVKILEESVFFFNIFLFKGIVIIGWVVLLMMIGWLGKVFCNCDV